MKISTLKIILYATFFFFGATIFGRDDSFAVQIDNLPQNRSHIRIFRNFGDEEEIIRNKYDLSHTTGVKNYSPDHIPLLYDLNTEMIVPSNKASSIKEWWCINKLQKTLDQCNISEDWLCKDESLCDVPEEIFLHFKNDTQITLSLGILNLFDSIRTGTVKGWDPDNFIDSNHDGFVDIDDNKDGYISDSEWEYRPNKNASARFMQDARVPSYYWGNFWEYLTGEIVDHKSNFALNVGNPDYQVFMSEVYIPGVLNDDINADGIYFDDSTRAYREIWDTWGKVDGYVEYSNEESYLNDNINLLSAIKGNIPFYKIIIGNGWHKNPFIIDGTQWETWLDISHPFHFFKNNIDNANDELGKGKICLLQFNPTYDENYIIGGKKISVSRERDQIYALASYYLIAGDTSYFGYGMHPYIDRGNLFFDAINVDVGNPIGEYYIFSVETKMDEKNILYNSNFETLKDNNDPDGWSLPFPDVVEIVPESECGLDGKCVKIDTKDLSDYTNYINSQEVTLTPFTNYTLSGYIKSENITGELSYGANFFPWDFDDSTPKLTGCKLNLKGTNNWKFTFCTFSTGTDIEGTINFRIQHGMGTAWFDNVELREGIPRIVLARKYSKALVLVRPRSNEGEDYEDPVIYKLHNIYQQVFADGSFGAPLNTVTLRSGEAAILLCTTWDGSKYITETDCLNTPPSAPVLESPSDGQIGLDTTVTFRWSHSRYPDEDTMTYSLTYCTNEDFTGCSPIFVSSRSDHNNYYAHRGNLSHLIILGMVFTGGIRNRKKFALLIVALLIASGMLISCGGGSGENSTSGVIDIISEKEYSVPEIGNTLSEHNYSVSGLNPSTTYYWKVTAVNSDGASESSTWSFKTR